MLVAEPARQLVARVEVDRFPCLRFRRIGAPFDPSTYAGTRSAGCTQNECRTSIVRATPASTLRGCGGRGSGVVLLEQDVDRVVLGPGPALPVAASGSHARMLQQHRHPPCRTRRSRYVQCFRPGAGSRFAPGGTGFAATVWASARFFAVKPSAARSLRPSRSHLRVSVQVASPPAPPRFSARVASLPYFAPKFSPPPPFGCTAPPVAKADNRLHGKKTRGRGKNKCSTSTRHTTFVLGRGEDEKQRQLLKLGERGRRHEEPHADGLRAHQLGNDPGPQFTTFVDTFVRTEE